MRFSLQLRQLLAVLFCMASLGLTVPALAQSGGNGKPPEPQKPAADAAKESQKKIDEITEASNTLTGPAGNPECVWLGRRVVTLLWRDDLDTAFRHLDLMTVLAARARIFRPLSVAWSAREISIPRPRKRSMARSMAAGLTPAWSPHRQRPPRHPPQRRRAEPPSASWRFL